MMLVSLSSFVNGDKVVDAHNLKEGAMEGCYLPPHITCNALDAAYDLSWEQIRQQLPRPTQAVIFRPSPLPAHANERARRRKRGIA